MGSPDDTRENKQEEKISVSLKRGTVELLDEVARKKVNMAMKNGSLDIINLIRSKRGRGVSYDSQINFLARIYLAVIDETFLTKDIVSRNPQLKKVLDRLNEINNFFLKSED
ncbi:MAG: hypothetical protein JXC85_03965 [Candidatus Aenigmarchaeota archaeon]|nr:hypothetical protein [Candidatus Aenigmarchaeota archaeon]